jgi:spore germination protein YaaH
VERETLVNNSDVINEVNFFWYELRSDSSIRAYKHAEDENVLAEARAAGLRIVPSIMNGFSRERVANIIHDPERRAFHVQEILATVLEMEYDGIDIDYEGLYAEDRDAFSVFIEELAEALHAHDKLLSIAVHPKTDEDGEWGGPLAQDWARLGAVVDEFKIMTYDYHWAASEAGPISPVEWADTVIEYATTLVPPEKVYMGVHFYGYDWRGESAESLTWSGATAIAYVNEAEIHRDESNEAWFTYGFENGHTVYFADSLSVETKLKAVFERHPNIAGIAIWRLGEEDPDSWPVIRQAVLGY